MRAKPGMGGRPQRALLEDGRLHLQHGPIDLVIGADGAVDEVARAYDQAARRFETVLDRLVEELPVLRMPIVEELPDVAGRVARRMAHAVWPFRCWYVTPMAAVAGAVADEVLDAMLARRVLARAYVNNGGDIALYLSEGRRFRVGIVTDVDRPGFDGTVTVDRGLGVGGVATSGRRGRSLSLGIADSVTVLGRSAAAADAAATLLGNAVDIDHPAVERRPANQVVADSDLGDLPVTVAVGGLKPEQVEAALDAGEATAASMLASGHIIAALMALRGRIRVVGDLGQLSLGRRSAA